MGIAFRAPRAPIERPKPPSSRFSFYRRSKTTSEIDLIKVIAKGLKVLELIIDALNLRVTTRR